MTPYISIAQTINELKPDLKDFWSAINKGTVRSELGKLLKLPCTPLNLFKLELLMIYMQTHNDIYINSHIEDQFIEYGKSANIDYSTLTKHYWRLTEFYLSSSRPISSKIILGNVTNPKQYLNPYLRSKLSVTESVSTAYSKSIEPNPMSLAIFQQWITTIKPFNSVQAEEFIKQCSKFPEDFKNDFINSILGHCPKPSIALQKYLTNYYRNLKNYPSINRNAIRSSSYKHLTFAAVLDQTDSAYKPFVANINRLAPDTEYELEATIGYALAILQQPNYSQVLYDELIKHAQQTPSDILNIYKANLLTAQQALNKLIKDL